MPRGPGLDAITRTRLTVRYAKTQRIVSLSANVFSPDEASSPCVGAAVNTLDLGSENTLPSARELARCDGENA